MTRTILPMALWLACGGLLFAQEAVPADPNAVPSQPAADSAPTLDGDPGNRPVGALPPTPQEPYRDLFSSQKVPSEGSSGLPESATPDRTTATDARSRVIVIETAPGTDRHEVIRQVTEELQQSGWAKVGTIDPSGKPTELLAEIQARPETSQALLLGLIETLRGLGVEKFRLRGDAENGEVVTVTAPASIPWRSVRSIEAAVAKHPPFTCRVLIAESDAPVTPVAISATPTDDLRYFTQGGSFTGSGGFPESAIPGKRYVMSAAGIVAFSDDGKTVYAYSERHPRWAEQKLDPIAGVQPMPLVGVAVIAVQQSHICYAYSPLLGTWDTLRLPKGEAAMPVIGQDAVQVNSTTKGDYVFKPAWGKWFSAEEIKQGKVAEHLAAIELAGALKGALSVKVFTLKHVDPNEIARLLANLYDRTPDLTIAADVARQSLLVRGPENILQEIEALLLKLDEAPPKKQTRVVPFQQEPTVPQTGAASPSPGPSGRAIHVLKVYKLQAAHPDQFEDFLRILVPDATVETDETNNSLIVSAPEAAFVNIDALIQQIDAQMVFMNTGKVTGDLSKWLDDSTRVELLNSWKRDNTIHTENLALKLRKTPAGQRDPGEVETLRKMVRQLFTVRQSLHREELADFERRVARMRESIELRERIVDRIVDRRVEELLDPNVKWEEIRSPEAAPPLVSGSRPGELPPPVSAGAGGKAPSPVTGSPIGLPGPPAIPRNVQPRAGSTSSGESREPVRGGSFDPALSGRYTLRAVNITGSDVLANLQGKPAYLQLEGQLLTVHVPQEGVYHQLPMLLIRRPDINPVAVDVIVDPNGDADQTRGILSVESTPQENVLRFCVWAIKSEAEIPESSRPMLFAHGSGVEYFEAVRPRAADDSNLPDLPGHQDPQAAETIWNSLGVRVRTAKALPVHGQTIRGGLEVTEVRPGFPAERAKLQAGDIIIGVGTWETINLNALVFALNKTRTEEKVRVTLIRGSAMLYTTFQWNASVPDPSDSPEPQVPSAVRAPAKEPAVPDNASEWLTRLQGRWEVTMAHAEDGRTQTAILPGLIQQDQFTMSRPDGSEPAAFQIRIGTPAEPQPVDLIPLVSSAEAKELGDAPLPVFQGIIEPSADGFRICLDANGDKVRPIVFAIGPDTVTYQLRRSDGTTSAGSPTPPAKAVDGPEQPNR